MEALSLEDFIVNHMNAESPVIVSGMMSDWPCMSCPERKWTAEYVRRVAGLRTVSVEIGARYTDSGWTQKLMTVGEFIDGFVLADGLAIAVEGTCFGSRSSAYVAGLGATSC